VVYARKKHLFTAADAERVSAAVLRQLRGREKTEAAARNFLYRLFRLLLRLFLSDILYEAIGEPLLAFWFGMLDRTVERWKKYTAGGLFVDPRAVTEGLSEDAQAVSGRSH
jgi:hypothetical protein